MRPRAIHQFNYSVAYGDGVTNGMLFMQRLLREAGILSNIYCVHIEPILAEAALSFQDYENRSDDLLLVHYSIGTGDDAWVSGVRSPRILVYHNITPAEFFPEGSEVRRLVDQGRRQLARWAQDRVFVGSIADSEFNARELEALGYRSVAPIALLVDLDRIRRQRWNVRFAKDLEGARNILFVGRLAENKGQRDLIHMTRHLCDLVETPIRLLLAGVTSFEAYEAELRAEISRLGLNERVHILGRRTNEDIYALYRHADLYISLSRHEGFGMPLVEAMAFDLPVLAAPGGAIAETLGPGGLILENTDPRKAAFAASAILRTPWLRRRVIEGQQESLKRFERPVLVAALQAHLRRLGFDVTMPREGAAVPPRRVVWTVEGPFDSSYSLAIVNREFARALLRSGETVTLQSRDGPGSFAPNEAFLAANPDVSAMARAGSEDPNPDICLRNQYPPDVVGMRGALRLFANFGWEESGFPAEWVRDFNASLDLVTVMSAFVAKVLRDNGVQIPIHVTGLGIDQILRGTSPVTAHRGSAFRFLHVSSGFPRKGIDVLLTAWAAAFSKHDAVELVIKTFPNVHNSVDIDVDDFQARHPDGAPVLVVNRVLDQNELLALYESADVLVCPGRGEGFGLPMAEAMAVGKPVITTAHGGQREFCTEATAWLCDYDFAYARTHFGLFDSVWAEPDPGSLSRIMRRVFHATDDERAARADAGRALVLSHHTWDKVAGRTRDAIAATIGSASTMPRPPRIGLVSTWNTRCGIAAYAKSLVAAIEPERLIVFADATGELIQPDEPFVYRCWTQGWSDPLEDLLNSIQDRNVDAVVIQFNFGFFHLHALGRLIDKLRAGGVLVFVTLHSTKDVVRPDLAARLVEIRAALAGACRLLVHSVHDLNRLKAIGLVDNVTIFPMGAPKPFNGDRTALRRSFGMETRSVVASFGYLLPNKGLRELIRAVGRLRVRMPQAHLLMLNALYPTHESTLERDACISQVRLLGLQENVTIVTDFLNEANVIALLAAADIIVYPYQSTQESSSAAVKTGLSSLTPIAVTPLEVFSDIAAVCYTLPGLTDIAIADGLLAFFSRPSAKSELVERQKHWIKAHAWPALSARLDGLIKGEVAERA